MNDQIVWFVLHNGKERGPFDSKQLRHLAKTGQITTETMLRSGTEVKWLPAARLKGLFPVSTPPTAIAQPSVLSADVEPASLQTPVVQRENVIHSQELRLPKTTDSPYQVASFSTLRSGELISTDASSVLPTVVASEALTTRTPFYSLEGWTRAIQCVSILQIIISLVIARSCVMFFLHIGQANEQMMLELTLTIKIASFVRLAAASVSGLLSLAWVYKAYLNLSALSVPRTRFTPITALLLCLVPALNFIMFCMLIHELWRTSDAARLPCSISSRLNRKPADQTVIQIWIILTLVSSFVAIVALILSRDVYSADSLRLLLMVLIVGHVIVVLEMGFMIWIVGSIHVFQLERYECLVGGLNAAKSPPLTPAFSDVSAKESNAAEDSATAPGSITRALSGFVTLTRAAQGTFIFSLLCCILYAILLYVDMKPPAVGSDFQHTAQISNLLLSLPGLVLYASLIISWRLLMLWVSAALSVAKNAGRESTRFSPSKAELLVALPIFNVVTTFQVFQELEALTEPLETLPTQLSKAKASLIFQFWRVLFFVTTILLAYGLSSHSYVPNNTAVLREMFMVQIAFSVAMATQLGIGIWLFSRTLDRMRRCYQKVHTL